MTTVANQVPLGNIFVFLSVSSATFLEPFREICDQNKSIFTLGDLPRLQHRLELMVKHLRSRVPGLQIKSQPSVSDPPEKKSEKRPPKSADLSQLDDEFRDRDRT